MEPKFNFKIKNMTSEGTVKQIKNFVFDAPDMLSALTVIEGLEVTHLILITDTDTNYITISVTFLADVIAHAVSTLLYDEELLQGITAMAESGLIEKINEVRPGLFIYENDPIYTVSLS